MKAILVVLGFSIVFVTLIANSSKNIIINKPKTVNTVNIVSVQEQEAQSFFASDPSSQIRNQIEFWEDSIIIPEPIH